MKKWIPPLLLLLFLWSEMRPLYAFPFDEAIQSASVYEKAERWLDARNELTRVLEWDRLSPALSVEDRASLQKRWDDANRRWIASLPPPAEPSTARARKRRAPAGASAPDGRNDSVDIGEVIRKAEAARRAGRLETALRLFRAASGLPGGEEAARAASEIESEVGGQAER